jgi:hypothetical protein
MHALLLPVGFSYPECTGDWGYILGHSRILHNRWKVLIFSSLRNISPGR